MKLTDAVKLAFYRWQYERKLTLMASFRERGMKPGVRLQMDALELLRKINALSARTV